MEQAMPKILIFGGTIFLGKSLLTYLKSNNLHYQIHCLNRGTPYWNDLVRKEHPQVIHHFCDRTNSHATLQLLKSLNAKLGICIQRKWKAVVDFSVFEEKQQQSLRQLEGLIQKYIMISTDSVYNNSTALRLPVKEAEFDLQAEINQLQTAGGIVDDYGYKKMKCEFNLSRMNLKPYVCLRLPDVIGEFDVDSGSQRFWCTLTWIKDSQKHPIPITANFKQKKLSFVDSYDLAHILHYLISSDKLLPHPAYNLCSKQALTLYQLYELIVKFELHQAQVLQTKPKYHVTKQKVGYFYPSVQFGTIDCQLATQQLGWKPTPIVFLFVKQFDSLRRVARFYAQQAHNYSKQQQQMRQQLAKYLSELQPTQ